MNLALECPTAMLGKIQSLADFDWILTHLVLQDEEYAKWYADSKNFKVLDNSVNELLDPCSLGEIDRAAKIVKPDLIVPPDLLGDSLGTEDYLLKALEMWPRDKILPVIQGCDLGHTYECAEYILKLGFDKIAVPYDINHSRTDSLDTMASGRLRVVSQIIGMVPVGFRIHLLGMTTLEELGLHYTGLVRSVDTGSPILHGLNGLRFGRDGLLSKEKPTLEKMPNEEPTDSRLADAYYNIAYLRKLLGGGRW